MLKLNKQTKYDLDKIEREYRKRETTRKITKGIIIVILVLWAVFSIIPLYWMFMMSFRNLTNAAYIEPTWWVKNPTLINFKRFFTETKALRWLLNSLIVSGAVTISNVIFASAAGYAFAKLKIPGKNKIFWAILAGMMIPSQVTLIPMYIMIVNKFGLGDTYGAIIIPPLCTINNVFLMKQYMSTLPTSLIHAARIDGCSEFGVYRKVILPIAKPGIAVLAIFTFVAMWNDFFWPFLITHSSSMRTIQVGLASFSTMLKTDWGLTMAGSVIAALPMFVLFFSLQKYFLKGITIGAVKG